jgi:hypothetical protein
MVVPAALRCRKNKQAAEWLLLFSGAVSLFSRPCFADGAVSPAEIVREALQVLRETIPRARANPRIPEWLDVLHISRAAFDQSLDRVMGIANGPFPPIGILYKDDPVGCHPPKVPRVFGYVDFHFRDKVRLCGPVFEKATGNSVAHTLAHEFNHVQGIQNECDAEGLAYLTFVSANVPTRSPHYVDRCASLRSLIDELNVDISTRKKKNYLLLPQTEKELNKKSVAAGNCVAYGDHAKYERVEGSSTELKLTSLFHPKKTKTVALLSDLKGGFVQVECYTKMVGMNDLLQLGIVGSAE